MGDNLTDKLEALDKAATQGEWRTEALVRCVQIWADTYIGETRDYYGDDAAFITTLVNAYRANQLAPVDAIGEPVALLHEHKAGGEVEVMRYSLGAGCLTDADKAAGWTETPLYALTRLEARNG